MAMLLSALCFGAARAEAAGPVLEIQPTEVTVDPSTGTDAPIVILLRGAPHVVFAGARLDFIAPAGIRAKITRAPQRPFTDEMSWRLDVNGSNAAPCPCKVVVLATYETVTSPGTHSTTAGTVSVTLLPPVAATSALKVTLLPAEGSIDELTPLALNLQIENPTRRTVDIDGIQRLTPQYVDLETPGPKAVTIKAGTSAILPLRATTTLAIPGTYPLIVAFRARFRGGPPVSETVVAQSKVTLGIPGVGEALQFLGIPSLLFLPGVLMIVTSAALYSLVSRRPPIDVKQPVLLALAVMLSFAAALIYPALTQHWFGAPRNYLHGYDLRDVAVLWVLSVAAGGIAGAFYALAQGWRNRTFQPNAGDTQLDVLRKLRRHGVRGFNLVQVQSRPANAAGAPGPILLVLPFGTVNPGERWLVPRAAVSPANDSQRALDRVTTITDALQAVENSTPGADDALLRAVKDGVSKTEITLQWDNQEAQGPRKIDDANYVSAGVAKRRFLHT